ncbi:glycoside hydrolase [Zalerion maritima]|uniref:Mannan endo-1,6-alpha-mannosidase n=1 Tax=Zalerion maritima TaxID=339359 RepID=A0AAD5RH46_9PEZI|nr:glycoside hydrolase [Zalerion maritima]
MAFSRAFVALVAMTGAALAALEVDLESADSIRRAARSVAYDLMTFYEGNQTGQTVGILPGPPPAGDYYWWQGGAMWGALIDYWHFTGDATYNPQIMEALLHQTGVDNNYMPRNWTASLGNDDQGFWGMTVLLAAENVFPNPPVDDDRQWLALAQAVFNTQASPERHDDYCNGGMRWQIPMSNNGYDYKNSIANGCFFNMGARLARYTGNDSYAEWARTTWDWMVGVQYIDDEYNIYDGAHIQENCTVINRAQFSYNAAVFLQGAAYMYAYTEGDEQAVWKDRVTQLLNATIRVFFQDGIAYEVSCETGMTCTTDMLSFKGYLHRWMATTAQIAPFTKETIVPVLKTSTEAAVKTCTGGTNGRMCGFKWKEGLFTTPPGTGAGQQMNVLGALSSYMIVLDETIEGPATNGTGGTSKGNPGAGTGDSGEWWRNDEPPPMADKVGAGFLTAFLLISIMAMLAWMSMDEKTEEQIFKERAEKEKKRASYLFAPRT